MKPLTREDLEAIGRERSPLPLTDSQAAALGVLHAHAFDGPRCCPSQELIGQYLGLTQARVCQILGELRDFGLIAWTKVRHRGATWAHNVYHLLVGWKAAGTSRVLALLERIRGRRARAIYTETATTASRTAARAKELRETLSAFPPVVWEEVDVGADGRTAVVLTT